MPDEGSPTDHELLRRHVAGDAEAFGELFRRHRDRLWAVALRTVCDPDEAADALQDAMVSAFRRAADFRGESAVTTWLHRIVVNASLDRLRRRAGHEHAFRVDPPALDLQGTDTDEHRPRGTQRDQFVRVHRKVLGGQRPGVLDVVSRHPVVFAGAGDVFHLLAVVTAMELCAPGTR